MNLLKKIGMFVILTLVRIYKYLISPLLGTNCRFFPSCSEYFTQSVKTYGVCKGSLKGIQRILKCHPWGGSGHDPVK